MKNGQHNSRHQQAAQIFIQTVTTTVNLKKIKYEKNQTRLEFKK